MLTIPDLIQREGKWWGGAIPPLLRHRPRVGVWYSAERKLTLPPGVYDITMHGSTARLQVNARTVVTL